MYMILELEAYNWTIIDLNTLMWTNLITYIEYENCNPESLGIFRNLTAELSSGSAIKL